MTGTPRPSSPLPLLPALPNTWRLHLLLPSSPFFSLLPSSLSPPPPLAAEAVERGCFGSPTLLVTVPTVPTPPSPCGDQVSPGEPSTLATAVQAETELTEHLLFGSDRIEQLGFLLGEEYHGANPRTERRRTPH
jgi:hypothetical protein